MTALIYKAALPTYTSLEALTANADENLVLNQAGTAYELVPAQGDASVRWFSGAEVLAAKGYWTITGTTLPVTSGGSGYPVYDTLVGPAEHFAIADSAFWESTVPTLLTPGIYEVEARVRWIANAAGGRWLRLLPFHEVQQVIPPNSEMTQWAGSAGPVNSQDQWVTSQIYVWDDTNPIGLGVAVSQDSGSTMNILKATISVTAYKLAEFL